MKTLLYISLFFFSIHCFGQTETKEDFLNEIDTAFVKVDITIAKSLKYELYKDAITIFPYFDSSSLKRDISKYADSFSVSQLISKATKDTIQTPWEFNKIKKATSCDGIPRLIKTRKNIYIEKREPHYTFSRPVFDDLSQYALISMGYSCGNTCGNGCFFLFKKINGHWQQIAEFECWLS